MTAERNGLTVELRRQPNGKLWMHVHTGPDGAPPSFEDWYHMMRALCLCELDKYSVRPDDPEEWDRWVDMPRRFLNACFERDITYEELRARFRLPR